MHYMQSKSKKMQLSGNSQVVTMRNDGQQKTKQFEAEPQNWRGDLKIFVS